MPGISTPIKHTEHIPARSPDNLGRKPKRSDFIFDLLRTAVQTRDIPEVYRASFCLYIPVNLQIKDIRHHPHLPKIPPLPVRRLYTDVPFSWHDTRKSPRKPAKQSQVPPSTAFVSIPSQPTPFLLQPDSYSVQKSGQVNITCRHFIDSVCKEMVFYSRVNLLL